MFPPLPTLSTRYGTLSSATGQIATVQGLDGRAAIGSRVRIKRQGDNIEGEVIRDTKAEQTIALYGSGHGLSSGMRVECINQPPLRPGPSWLGHILDHEGKDASGLLRPSGSENIVLDQKPPSPGHRRSLGPRLRTGMAAIDTFLPLCRGQRIGLFAGSGVGKTSLLGKLAAQSNADVNVIALIGERGREVRSFVENTLGVEALKKTVVFAATSDQPPAIKLRAARLAMATAESFRDAGQHVLFLFDSLTRFAQAHREVALAAGEVPALHAYPPSTFPALAQLCERAGPGHINGTGDITAVLSVLVQGSDMEEPIADTVRGILDGHVILDRAIAESGRYPAIDVGRSVSRALPEVATQEENKILSKSRRLIRRFEDGQLMVQSGLYKAGSDPLLDKAVEAWPKFEAFLQKDDYLDIPSSFTDLEACLGED